MIRKFMCFLGYHTHKDLIDYGWPIGFVTFHQVFKCQHCGKTWTVRGGMFAPVRDTKMYPIDENCMLSAFEDRLTEIALESAELKGRLSELRDTTN